ncbi:LOW QUALITY PROTEIN: uncharacterized protein C6orf223-like [Neovison vison]|uniref:LOW QUALITY PROTEIN: uncharacterized protein C6orf223-like n=1 Tax=Neovison vison TaxID=452646 RepID=UPI001CF07F4E|nr:LOW QUALITY PROTEIN: uncharacterized protein C6orf223-like [Neogale vison]
MMPLTEAGAPAQGGGPAGTGWARPALLYLVVPSLLKTRASKRGETSHVLEDRKSRGRRWRLPRQKSFLHGLCRPLRPHPGFGESDSAELASLHLLPRTRSARRNYRIAGARLMRSNYPPPLFSAALCCAGPTHPN